MDEPDGKKVCSACAGQCVHLGQLVHLEQLEQLKYY